jgi:hypothetical protein
MNPDSLRFIYYDTQKTDFLENNVKIFENNFYYTQGDIKKEPEAISFELLDIENYLLDKA